MRTPSYVVGIVQSGKGLSFAAKRHKVCAVVAGVEVFVAGLCGVTQVARTQTHLLLPPHLGVLLGSGIACYLK